MALAIYDAAVPVGAALGYILGGLIGQCMQNPSMFLIFFKTWVGNTRL